MVSPGGIEEVVPLKIEGGVAEGVRYTSIGQQHTSVGLRLSVGKHVMALAEAIGRGEANGEGGEAQG